MGAFAFKDLKKGQRLLSPVGYIGTSIVMGYRRVQVVSPEIKTDESGNRTSLGLLVPRPHRPMSI